MHDLRSIRYCRRGGAFLKVIRQIRGPLVGSRGKAPAGDLEGGAPPEAEALKNNTLNFEANCEEIWK